MANQFKTEHQMHQELADAKKQLEIGGFYAHYKHPHEKRYQVIDVAIFEDTEEVCVVYKSLQMGALWIRTLEDFLSEVEVEGKKVKRFELI